MLKVIDLFSGIGGFALGLKSTGYFKTVQFVENDKWCQKILAKNFPGVPIHEDVKTFQGYDSDVVVGGFPCQPFSVAGKQQAIQDDRHLWPDMFRVIKETKPTWVIGENVRNIVSISDGMVLEQVYIDLESEGYEVQSFIIPASAVNAPHQRYRTWIVAHTECMGWEQRATQSEKFEGKATPNKFNYSSKRRSIGKAGEDVANTESSIGYDDEAVTRDGGSSTQEVFGNGSSVSGEGSWWHTEPNVGRVAHGIPNRVDRLKGLGNAIVPQIAYQIGKAIRDAEKEI
tara:strand:- start:2288 stop:3145 length:858 start_codon:yes stop_codon:yes gene_type:complete